MKDISLKQKNSTGNNGGLSLKRINEKRCALTRKYVAINYLKPL